MNATTKHLEEKIAHLEHHVTQQDKAMLEFADDLGRLRRELKLLVDRLAHADPRTENDSDDGRLDERPPHY